MSVNLGKLDRSQPFTPKEARESKKTSIPGAVFDVINEFLGLRYGEKRTIRITQKEVLEALKKQIDITGWDENGWLDIEPIYRKYGWGVIYDKPGHNETYDAFWEFSEK